MANCVWSASRPVMILPVAACSTGVLSHDTEGDKNKKTAGDSFEDGQPDENGQKTSALVPWH